MLKKLTLVAAVAVGLLAGVVAQPNTPQTYSAGNHKSSTDPCSDISIRAWQDVPSDRITVDPNFDDGVPADYASVWTGLDRLYFFPNGFRKGQVYENNDPPFCFYVPGTTNRGVQIMIQTVDSQARLCLKDTQTSNVRMGGTIDRCFTGSTTACFGGYTYDQNGGGMNMVVYTDSTAATTATPFWYRVRTSDQTWTLTGSAAADSAISTLEMWCMQIEQDPLLMRFPKELRSPVAPASKEAVTGAASAQTASAVAVLGLAFATIAATFRQ